MTIKIIAAGAGALFTPSHPSEIIKKDVINALGISVTEAAARLAMSRVTLSRVLNDRTAISPNLAVRLETAGVSNGRAWLAIFGHSMIFDKLASASSRALDLCGGRHRD